MLAAIIVAAGSSRRMGFDKLLAPLAGKPLIAHTIEAFEIAESVTEIILATHENRRRELEEIARPMKKLREIVVGGERRQDSVRAGLAYLSQRASYVAVHDGARPLIMPGEIERTFNAAQVHGAAALAEPISDTLKRASAELTVVESLDRDSLYAMQTPQVFRRTILEQAYGRVFQEEIHVTDEVSAVEHVGGKVVLVPGNEFNLKVTYQRDLQLADWILQQRAKERRFPTGGF